MQSLESSLRQTRNLTTRWNENHTSSSRMSSSSSSSCDWLWRNWSLCSNSLANDTKASLYLSHSDKAKPSYIHRWAVSRRRSSAKINNSNNSATSTTLQRHLSRHSNMCHITTHTDSDSAVGLSVCLSVWVAGQLLLQFIRKKKTDQRRACTTL